MFCWGAEGAKDPGLHKAGVLLPEQADGAGPVQGVGKTVAWKRCPVLVPD